MIRRRHALVALLVSPIAVMAAGCDDTTQATPQVIFDATLSRGPGNDCSDSGPVFTVGDFGNQALDTKVKTQPIKDGQAFGQGTVSISCSVVAAGNNEFNVTGAVSLTGATGGFFRIDGHFKTTGRQEDVHAIFSSRRTGNSYDEVDRKCTVDYTTPVQGVASGRVWGQITCPNITNDTAGKSCTGVAQFRFENCAE